MTASDAPICLVDLDNTVVDFFGHLDAGLARLHPDQPLHDRSRFVIWGDDVDRNAAIRDVITEQDFFATMPVYDGARDALIQMQRAGISVVVCTSPMTSNPMSWSAKAAWVRRHLGQRFVEALAIAGDKTLVRGDVLVDDRVGLTGRREPEWQQVFFTQPYNADIDGPHLDRWANWEEVISPLIGGGDFR
ncbi:hypothetical protein ACFOYW_04550 [Gryllotalpicola reticulitermitis]|uniref:Uncharacterized protein n=1 Tax=Gryllotalpicola reticulitermitis TaxID=1184153 RepID=A0ABV8Q663_9MICO